MNLYKLLLTITLLFLPLSFVFAGASDYGLNTTGVNLPLKATPSEATTKVGEFVGRIINTLLGAVGLIFLILIIYGGFLWLTSAGEQSKVKKGKDILVWSVIGLIVIMSAYLITSFIIGAVGTPPTE